MITTTGQVILPRKEVGSRPATRVRINAPQGSRFNGEYGIVASVVHLTDHHVTLMVDLGHGVLPFGVGEVEVLS